MATTSVNRYDICLVRVEGIEPSNPVWKTGRLPLSIPAKGEGLFLRESFALKPGGGYEDCTRLQAIQRAVDPRSAAKASRALLVSVAFKMAATHESIALPSLHSPAWVAGVEPAR